MLHFPKPMAIEDAYTGSRCGDGVESLELDMGLWETGLFYTL
jgi:hypothetical protein